MFSSCSLEVPQILKFFLKAYTIASHFYPIWFAQSLTVYKLKRSAIWEYICFHFATEVQRGACIGEHLSVPKTNVDGPMNMAFSPPKKKL
jgi:hypothetical protein